MKKSTDEKKEMVFLFSPTIVFEYYWRFSLELDKIYKN